MQMLRQTMFLMHISDHGEIQTFEAAMVLWGATFAGDKYRMGGFTTTIAESRIHHRVTQGVLVIFTSPFGGDKTLDYS